MATIQDFIKQWKKALQIEVDLLKTKGGTGIGVTDGKCLTSGENGATYWFTLDSESYLPDGTPIRIEYKDNSFHGQVISVEGFDVILKTDVYFGREISEAVIYSEPWELLLALIERLDEINENPMKQKRAVRLISAKAPAKHPTEQAKTAVGELILRANYNATTFVWGPPGTGKTYTLARMAAKHYSIGKKILILAHSNAAVDVLLLELASFLKSNGNWKPGEVLRYGFSSDPKLREHTDILASAFAENNNPELTTKVNDLESKRERLKNDYRYDQGGKLASIESELQEVRRKIKKEEEKYIGYAKVLGVTLSKAALDPSIYQQDFDLVIVDEASMAYVPQIVFASTLGKRIVVTGDFKQLPPIAMANNKYVEKWLKKDIFHATKIVDTVQEGKTHHNLFMLTEQRRMHPDIASFTNDYIYRNKVKNHRHVSKKREHIVESGPFPNEAAILVDLSSAGAFALTDSSSESRYNLFSAVLSMQLILEGKREGTNSIGFITPFRAQARLMNTLIQDLIPDNLSAQGNEKIIAATVHKFQGSERDMIIFDQVDSYPQKRASILMTNENSDKLINVAVTRARGKFITLADKKFIDSRVSKSNMSRELTNHLTNNYTSYTRTELPNLVNERTNSDLQWFDQKDSSLLFRDLQNAKKILISAPFPAKIDSSIWSVLQNIEGRTDIKFITNKREDIPLKRVGHIPADIVMPFIQIDRDILWIGTPIMETNFESSPKPPFIKGRLVSQKTIKLLNSYLNLPKATFSEIKKPEKVISYRPSYTLRQYISSWDQCPSCRSIRKIEETKDGRTMLVCEYCGKSNRIPDWLLQKYLDYADLRCRTCNTTIETAGDWKDLHCECPKCTVRIELNSLL